MSGPDAIFVSDLHVAPDSAFGGAAFAALVEQLVARSSHSQRTFDLVALGDIFHFPAAVSRAADADAVDCITAIARAHPDLLRALAMVVESGNNLVIVPGNHDIDLHREPVRQRLAELLEVPFQFEPWIYHRPGLVYAEHGSQYHDINRCSTWLDPTIIPGGPMRPPLTAILGTQNFTHRLHELREVLTQPRLADAGRAYRSSVLPGYARSSSLDLATLQTIDRVGEAGVVKTARRLAARTVTNTMATVGWDARAERDAYLLDLVPAVQTALEAADAAVPYFVFGHTHRARTVALRAGATYLNCGTWASGMGQGAAATFVAIEAGRAGLLRWDDSDGIVEHVQPNPDRGERPSPRAS